MGMDLKPEEIAQLPMKKVSVEQFIRIVRRFMPDGDMEPLQKQLIEKYEDGAYLGVHKLPSGKMVRLHLQKIWMQPYTLGYSAHPDSKSGKEIFISNFKMPKYNSCKNLSSSKPTT